MNSKVIEHLLKIPLWVFALAKTPPAVNSIIIIISCSTFEHVLFDGLSLESD